VLLENDQVIAANYTLPAGKNAVAVGPITIDTDVSIVIGTGQKLIIL
jgi:hypothetical protein